jgi:hypothetical protein
VIWLIVACAVVGLVVLGVAVVMALRARTAYEIPALRFSAQQEIRRIKRHRRWRP